MLKPESWNIRSFRDKLVVSCIYQTFCVIFDYLASSGKIATDREGKIAWIWNPELVRKFLKPELVVR